MSSRLLELLEEAKKQMTQDFLASLPEIDRIWGFREARCENIDDGFRCTKKTSHEGDHVAHGMFMIVRRWPRA